MPEKLNANFEYYNSGNSKNFSLDILDSETNLQNFDSSNSESYILNSAYFNINSHSNFN